MKMIKIDEVTGMLQFPADQRWLNGEEYAFLIRHHLAYCYAEIGLKSFMTLTKHAHPEKVYDQPNSKWQKSRIRIYLFFNDFV